MSAHPIPTDPRFKNLTGQRFGRWRIVSYAGRKRSPTYGTGNSLWLCRCECGVEKVMTQWQVKAVADIPCPHPRPYLQQLLGGLVKEGPKGCWVWHGTNYVRGYGYITYRRKGVLAHRLAYEYFRAIIPDGLLVCHTCDNRPCCNPFHLFLGTVADNTADMIAKGRNSRGERHPGAVLTEDLVREMRRLAGAGLRIIEIARMFGYERHTVGSAVRRKSWKHVE